MNALLLPLFVLLGVMAGSLIGTQTGRWIALIWISTTQHSGDFLGPPRRRLLWALPFIVIVHPAPYIICMVAAVTSCCFRGRMPVGWAWFLAGFYLYLVLVGWKVLALFRRRQLLRPKMPKP
jgi:hypothetical protein